MKRIDSHQHFWKFDPVRDSWINDEMKVIQKNFFPKNLELLLAENNFDGCIAVQASQSEDETNFLIGLAKENNFMKGVVGWADFMAENIEQRLEYYKSFKVVKGFRHILQDEEDRKFMLQPNFMRGISALQKNNFTYDILIYTDQLKYIKDFVAAFPNQKFVIDHLAKPDIKNHILEEWKTDICAIAKYENVYCKISGMVTEAAWKNWTQKDFEPYLETVTEAFGINRIMFGSDWPVCLVSGSYTEVVNIATDYFSSFSASEQNKFFGANAIQFYNLPLSSSVA